MSFVLFKEEEEEEEGAGYMLASMFTASLRQIWGRRKYHNQSPDLTSLGFADRHHDVDDDPESSCICE